MNKTSMNLQDLFLNQVRKESIPVTIYLVSGVQLKGLVRGFDAFTLVLESPGKPPQLVYKHAMASVVPARPVGGVLLREERPPEQAQPPAPAPPVEPVQPVEAAEPAEPEETPEAAEPASEE
jgi:host factor-I protein